MRGEDFASDIAVDDISMSHGSCGDYLTRCDFNNNSQPFCDWTQICGSSQGTWIRTKHATPTPETGPEGDYPDGRGYFIYQEASNLVPFDTNRLESPVLVVSGEVCIDFWYHMHGSEDLNELKVIILAETEESEVWSRKGNQSSAWLHGLTAVHFGKERRIQVAFEAVRGLTEYGDTAMDNVAVRSGPCSAPSPCDLSCSFDTDLCSWRQSSSDSTDWTRHKGPTPSPTTGPSFDHTTGDGYFIYLDGSRAEEGDVAHLVSPTCSSHKPQCFRFWYHMYGVARTMSLRVYVASGSAAPELIWSASGNQGNRWWKAEVSVAHQGSVQIILEGVRGEDYRSDVAVDDISVVDGYCSEPTTTPVNTPALPSSESCLVSGDPHYYTFDKHTHHFMGNCTYTLSRLCSQNSSLPFFNVEATNEHRGGNTQVSYVQSVDVDVSGVRITLGKGGVVKVNGAEVTVPASPAPGVEVRSSGFYRVVSTDFGLRVKFDGDHQVELTLPSAYRAQVCGLCGNYNGNPADDFQNPSGGLEPDSASLGVSWQVSNSTSCSSGSEPTCTEAEKEVAQSSSFCGLITDVTGPFRHCHGAFGPAGHFASCLYDQCALHLDPGALCRSLQAYADACQALGVRVESWRNATFCPVSCPPNSHYEACATACPPTCVDPTAPAACGLPCAEACLCDSGFLLYDGTCVPSGQCGCWHEGRHYPVGAEFWADDTCSSKCTCPSRGGQLSCSSASCPEGYYCGVQSGVRQCLAHTYGVCQAYGDPHYYTFDGVTHHFMGICTYTLAKVCANATGLPSFNIEAKNEHRGNPSVSYIQRVLVEVYGQQIEILKNSPSRVLTLVLLRMHAVPPPRRLGALRDNSPAILSAGSPWREGLGPPFGGRILSVSESPASLAVNKVWATLPVVRLNGAVTVSRSGRYVALETDFRLRVSYDADHSVEIRLPVTYFNRTCGLCGNFDGRRQDDSMMPDGQQAQTSTQLGQSWQVPGAEHDEDSCGGPGATVPPPPPCLPETEALCGLLTSKQGPFEACHSAISPTGFFESCVFDVCAGSLQLLCSALESYADACQGVGVNLPRWRNSTFCRECRCCRQIPPVAPVRVTSRVFWDGRGTLPVCSLLRLPSDDAIPFSLGFRPDLASFPDHRWEGVPLQRPPPSLQWAVQAHCAVTDPRGRTLSCNALPCPPNAHYEPCATACPATCLQQQAPENCSQPCVEDCACDAGLVLSGRDCVAASSCGCVHAGQYYLQGESFVTEDCSQSCKCGGNGAMECVALSCSPEEVCRVQEGLRGCYPARTATCHVYGDPHYSTFDGRLHHFQGACNYTLVQACNHSSAPFSITARNEHRGSPLWTALNSVAVTLQGLHIALRKGRAVYINGVLARPPILSLPGATIQLIGSHVHFATDLGVRIRFDGDQDLLVSVTESHRGRVCGLCGTYTGDPRDDFTTPTGEVVGDTNAFGNSWRVSDDHWPCNSSIASPEACPPPEQQAAEKRCQVLSAGDGPFAPCHAAVPPQPYLESCTQDLCATGGSSAQLCSLLRSYAAACQAAGVALGDWEADTVCASCFFNCSFDDQDFCEWQQSVLGDFDWSLSEDCPLPATDGCSSPGGRHIFADSHFARARETGLLVSPGCTAREPACFRFWYRTAVASEEDALKVYVAPEGGAGPLLVWSVSESTGDRWLQAEVDLHISGRFQARFHIQKPVLLQGQPFLLQHLPPQKQALPGQFFAWQEFRFQILLTSEVLEPTTTPVNTPAPPRPEPTTTPVNTPALPSSESCLVSGDPHYYTFDKHTHHFMGNCTYTLSRLCSQNSSLPFFNVEATNEHRGGNTQVSYVQSVDVDVSGVRITLGKGGVVKVNGAEVTVPASPAPGVEVRSSGFYRVVSTDFGLRVKFDGDHQVELTLPSAYRAQVCGLCGNYNGNPADDFQNPSGGLEPDSASLGVSWQVSNSTSCSSGSEPTCTEAEKEVAQSSSFCGLITDVTGPFRHCHGAFGPAGHFASCLYDQCALHLDPGALCRSLQAYADACQALGVRVESWRNATFCRKSGGPSPRLAGARSGWLGRELRPIRLPEDPAVGLALFGCTAATGVRA
ncbi:IgGFc-binding protein-like [Tiliqua scincoides]|uniref:IgGFc-binding protein-like n=1 Tax=Tiliqua scincoides TaxID=71010 RepID=UPI003462D89E